MRSVRVSKRALQQVTQPEGTWPHEQGVDEADMPGNKSTASTKPEISKDASSAKQADWMGDLIRNTIYWISKHRNDPDVEDKVGELPIASKTGVTALQGPVSKFVSSGNSAELSSDLEALLTKKRAIAAFEDFGEDEEDYSEPPMCPECGGPGVELGKLGPRLHCRCRNCGMDFSEDTSKASDVELYTPKTSAEVDAIVAASAPWVNKRANSGVMADGSLPRFIINASKAVAVVSSLNEVFVDADGHPSNRYAKLFGLGKDKEDTTGMHPTTPRPRFPGEGLRCVYCNRYMPVEAAKMGKNCPSCGAPVEESIGHAPVGWDQPSEMKTPVGDRFKRMQPDRFRKAPQQASLQNLKSASGGAEDEPENEEETTVDSSVVGLLEACKREWVNLGDPVNPATWPKEVERAILALNDDVVAAIQKIEDQLTDGDFYSKNVDEGVDQQQGGSLLTGLNAEEPVREEAEPGLERKHASLKLAEVTPVDTRRALKHVQGLKDSITDQFFSYKKVVEGANDSSVIRAIGEDMVAMKTRLDEAEKILTKQLAALEEAEKSVDNKMKEQEKKTSASAKTANQYIQHRPGHKDSKGNKAEWVVLNKENRVISSHATEEKAKASFAAMETSKRGSVKTGNCPQCGAPTPSNGTACPNCQSGQDTATPSTQPTTAVNPQVVKPQTPQSPVKSYGSNLMAGLNVE